MKRHFDANAKRAAVCILSRNVINSLETRYSPASLFSASQDFSARMAKPLPAWVI